MKNGIVAYKYTEQLVARVITEARGDIFVASQMLGVNVAKLDRDIRLSEHLHHVFLTVKEVNSLPKYEAAALKQFEAEVARRVSMYRIDGLEALHDLAVMPISENSAQNQVKLAAAARCAANAEQPIRESEVEVTLRQLNEAYHQNAPRIKITRERTTFEMQPQTVERVIQE